MEPKRIFAMVGRYADAITEARNNGCTWKELLDSLAPVIGANNERVLANAYRRAMRAIESERISPKQLALPPLPGKKTPAVVSGGGVTKRLITEKRAAVSESGDGDNSWLDQYRLDK